MNGIQDSSALCLPGAISNQHIQHVVNETWLEHAETSFLPERALHQDLDPIFDDCELAYEPLNHYVIREEDDEPEEDYATHDHGDSVWPR